MVLLTINSVFTLKEMNFWYNKTHLKKTLGKTALPSGMGQSLQHILKLKVECGSGSCRLGPFTSDSLQPLPAQCGPGALPPPAIAWERTFPVRTATAAFQLD